jgi:5-methylcytosine-specific restriction endonuclease McrA
MKGKHHTEESNQKNREAHLGSKSPNWKGGVSVGENQKKYWVMKAEERRARKLNAEGTYTMEEWETLKAVYNHRCPACSRGEPEVELVRDHIRPLITGGTNYINNIQPLCRSCNAKKWSKEILYVQQLALVSS